MGVRQDTPRPLVARIGSGMVRLAGTAPAGRTSGRLLPYGHTRFKRNSGADWHTGSAGVGSRRGDRPAAEMVRTANGAADQRSVAPFIPPVWYRARPWDPPITNDAACL